MIKHTNTKAEITNRTKRRKKESIEDPSQEVQVPKVVKAEAAAKIHKSKNDLQENLVLPAVA